MRCLQAAMTTDLTAIPAPKGGERVLIDIVQRNGQVVRVSLYRERGLPPILGIRIGHPRTDGTIAPDHYRTLRFFPDEWRDLADALARAVEEGTRLGWLAPEAPSPEMEEPTR
jgi:hypothetical protein